MHLHDVEFPGGEVTLLPANDITQAMYAQHNVDGNKYLLLECFMNMQKDPTAISLDEQKVIYNGREYISCNTLGWFLCCQWDYDSTSWEKLSDEKEAIPYKLPIRQWIWKQVMSLVSFCGNHMLKKRDAIITLLQKHSAKYLKQIYQFGVECPKTVKDALKLDKWNGNTVLADAAVKEMKNFKVASDPLECGVQPYNGYHL